jgi:hypothetical protein
MSRGRLDQPDLFARSEAAHQETAWVLSDEERAEQEARDERKREALRALLREAQEAEAMPWGDMQNALRKEVMFYHGVRAVFPPDVVEAMSQAWYRELRRLYRPFGSYDDDILADHQTVAPN